jgi:hypothetical protein
MEDPTPSPHYEGRFLPEVEQILREAGWFPGRVVPVDQLKQWMVLEETLENGSILQLRMFSAAWRILREFGGLTIHQDAHGITLPRETFFFDPLRGGWWGSNWFFDEWQADGALFPLGNWGNSHGSVYQTDAFGFAVTGQGKIINEFGELLGNTIGEALTNLILGDGLEMYKAPQDKVAESSYVHPFMIQRFYP